MECVFLGIILFFILLVIILKIKNILNLKWFLAGVLSNTIIASGLVYMLITKQNIIFKLNGSNKITIKLNEEYKDEGVVALIDGVDYSNDVTVNSNIDTTKVGMQKIIYQLIYNNKTYTIERNINIIDDIKPVITISNKTEYICPNYNLEDYQIKAIDNYDGDISDKIKIKEKYIDKDNIEVTFKVSDNSGNTAEEKKRFIKKDDTRPEINLNGNSNIYITLGKKFEDPGYEAIDNCDGNLTKEVVKVGQVNTDKEGVYVLKYEVSDESGNKTTLIRTINVISENSTKNKIYLTFDDGPSDITVQILDILKEEGVSATFFINGFDSDKNYIVQRIVNEGHTIAIHGMSHSYKDIYSSEDAYMENINSLQDQIYDVTGIQTWITRFPGGSSNTISKFNDGIMTRLTKLVIEEGYHYFDWNIDSGDAASAYISSIVYDNVVTKLNHDRQNVVLMHDSNNKTQTLESLRNIIEYGKNNGYVFDKITMDTPLVIHSVNN